MSETEVLYSLKINRKKIITGMIMEALVGLILFTTLVLLLATLQEESMWITTPLAMLAALVVFVLVRRLPGRAMWLTFERLARKQTRVAHGQGYVIQRSGRGVTRVWLLVCPEGVRFQLGDGVPNRGTLPKEVTLLSMDFLTDRGLMNKLRRFAPGIPMRATYIRPRTLKEPLLVKLELDKTED
jgi:hypothetical protein